MFRTGAQMSLLILLAGLFFLRESNLWPVREADNAFADYLAVADRALLAQAEKRGWATPPKEAPVVLVAIDDASLSDHAWPWSPIDFALFLRAALPFKPEVVAIEEVLDWDHSNLPQAERMKLPQYERMLRDALLRTPKILLGQRLGWPEDPDAIPPIQEAPIIRRVKGNLREVPEWTVIDAQPKEDFRLSSRLGFTNLPQGLPSTTMAPLVLRYQGQIVPSFVLQAVLLWQKLSDDDVEVVLGSHIALGPKLRIPIDKHGQMRINFGAAKMRIGFDELLLASEQIAAQQKPAVPVEKLAGCIALLARTDTAAQTLPAALGKRTSPGEVFASGIATIQHGAFIQRASCWFDFALIGVAMLIGLRIPRMGRRPVALCALLVFVIYLVAAFAVFHLSRVWLPVVLPAGLLLFIALYRLATPNSVWRLRKPVIL